MFDCCRALEKTAPSAGSNFAQEASAAASRVTDALKQLLLHRLSLPCDSEAENGGANPGALCYDDVFKLVTTARALIVSGGNLGLVDLQYVQDIYYTAVVVLL